MKCPRIKKKKVNILPDGPRAKIIPSKFLPRHNVGHFGPVHLRSAVNIGSDPAEETLRLLAAAKDGNSVQKEAVVLTVGL